MIACLAARRVGAMSFAVVAAATLLPAQQSLDREITFVRALAKDLRLIELARLEAEDLARRHASGSAQEKIGQLAVEIAYLGARSRSDRAQQRALFKETVAKSKELIDTSTDPTVQFDARVTLANASQDFGQFLTEELEIAREQAPDRVRELTEEATSVFRTGIDACTKVMDVLRSQRKDESKNTQYYLMWMKKAVLAREQGRADRENRGVLVARAIADLEEMVLEVGEETAIGLRGLFEIAQCREVEGNMTEAIASYRGTIGQIATALTQAQKGELDLTGEMQAFLFEMMQEVYVRTAEVMVREGAPDTAALFAEFRKHMTTFGEKGADLFDIVSDSFGHLMLLAESRFLAESGDPKKVADALAMAQRINDRHPADFVGVRAKAVLRDILGLQSSLVSGSLLFEIAKGEMQNRNYEEAIKRLRRALTTMTAEEQQKLALPAYEMMGLAFAYGDRYLEAIIALTTGLQRHGARDKDKASDVADALDRAIGAHRRQVRNDPAFETFYAEPLQQVKEYSVSGGAKLFWKQANDLFNQRKYAEAIAQYAEIKPDFTHYEAALVNIARAHAATGDFARARQALTAFRDHVARTTLAASDTGKQQVRQSALADAEFAEVSMLYAEARGSEEPKRERDLTKYPAAIEKAQGFVANFEKDGERNIPLALEYLGRLSADLAKLDDAEAAYVQLKAKDPVRASRLATEIFREYQNQVKSLNDELTQAIAKGATDAAINKATNDVNAVRRKLVALGMDYIANAPKPQLGILVATMNGWEELGDWKRVDEVAKKTLEVYGNDTAEATKRVVDQIVRPKVGEALLQQQRFQEAYDMLIAAEQANPTHWELKRLICRALGGWFEFNATGAGVRVPGLDRPAEAYHKYFTEYRTWALRPEVAQYSLEWYRFQWELYWFARQAGQKDGKMKEIAEKIYRIARATDDFATLRGHGPEGLRLLRYFQSNR